MGPLHGLLFSGVEKKMRANVCAVKMATVKANCHSLAPTLCKRAAVLLKTFLPPQATVVSSTHFKVYYEVNKEAGIF